MKGSDKTAMIHSLRRLTKDDLIDTIFAVVGESERLMDSIGDYITNQGIVLDEREDHASQPTPLAYVMRMHDDIYSDVKEALQLTCNPKRKSEVRLEDYEDSEDVDEEEKDTMPNHIKNATFELPVALLVAQIFAGADQDVIEDLAGTVLRYLQEKESS